MTQKTTAEIKTLLNNAQIDFDLVENKVLNDYLPKNFEVALYKRYLLNKTALRMVSFQEDVQIAES